MSQLLRVALILAPLALSPLTACSIHVDDDGWHGFGRHWKGVRGSGVPATVTHELPAFSRVRVSGAMDLVVTRGPTTPVEVSGDDNILPHLRIEVDGETLVVEPRHGISPRSPIVVRASTPSLEGIEVSGASCVSVHDLHSNSLEIDASGASDVRVRGHSVRVVVESSGASDVDLSELVTRTAEVEASGASDIDVHAEEELHAHVSGAASVRNHGGGAVVGNVSGAGSLSPRRR